jgi:cytochrome P450
VDHHPHDASVWADPDAFAPERFLPSEGSAGPDAFGADRHVCPGKNMGLTTMALWVARLVHIVEWVSL